MHVRVELFLMEAARQIVFPAFMERIVWNCSERAVPYIYPGRRECVCAESIC